MQKMVECFLLRGQGPFLMKMMNGKKMARAAKKKCIIGSCPTKILLATINSPDKLSYTDPFIITSVSIAFF